MSDLHACEVCEREPQLPQTYRRLPGLSDRDALCAGYEAHHWESTSNCLHACGMLWAFGVLALMLLRQKRWPMLALVPPCWYLFAWTGHFVYQAGGSVMGGPERRLPPSPRSLLL